MTPAKEVWVSSDYWEGLKAGATEVDRESLPWIAQLSGVPIHLQKNFPEKTFLVLRMDGSFDVHSGLAGAVRNLKLKLPWSP